LHIFGLESLLTQQDAPPVLHDLAERRVAARLSKDFDQADRLRQEIEDEGWEIRDIPGARYQLVPRQ
jgi:cysteinyl-tRNA synthetase